MREGAIESGGIQIFPKYLNFSADKMPGIGHVRFAATSDLLLRVFVQPLRHGDLIEKLKQDDDGVHAVLIGRVFTPHVSRGSEEFDTTKRVLQFQSTPFPKAAFSGNPLVLKPGIGEYLKEKIGKGFEWKVE